jgi:hypothetical protein
MERLLVRAAAAAKASRAEIERQGMLAVRWCDRCRRHHPPTFRWLGRERPWCAAPPRAKPLEVAARIWAEQ